MNLTNKHHLDQYCAVLICTTQTMAEGFFHYFYYYVQLIWR